MSKTDLALPLRRYACSTTNRQAIYAVMFHVATTKGARNVQGETIQHHCAEGIHQGHITETGHLLRELPGRGRKNSDHIVQAQH